MPLTFSIVTQEREVLRRDDIERLIVPTTEGQITVLPSHAPLMASLAVGEIIARAPGEDMVLAIHGGFFQIANDETIDEIDEARADAARERAEQRLTGTPTDGEAIDLLRAQLALQRALLRLRVSRRAGTSSGAPSVRA